MSGSSATGAAVPETPHVDPGPEMTVVPFALIFVLFCVLGARLLRSAFSTRGAEVWLACFFLGSALAIPLRLPTIEPTLASGAWIPVANAIGHLMMSAAIAGFTLFVWRVFRGPERWATALGWTLLSMQAISWLGLIAFGGYREEANYSVLACNVVRSVPFAWGFAESLRYHRLMKRRMKMNLANSVVANRFGLFSIWSGALFFMPAAILVVRIVVLGDAPATSGAQRAAWVMPLVRVTLLVGGGVSFGALWLSFFPPRRYLEYMQRRMQDA